MLQKLKSRTGEAMIIAMVGSVVFFCALSYLKANQKNKTVDTVSNPATPEYDR